MDHNKNVRSSFIYNSNKAQIKYMLQSLFASLNMQKDFRRHTNSFSTTALKMCNCGLKVKLKIFIILHPHAHDVTGRLGRLGGDELYAANTPGWGNIWTRPPAPASHISIVSGIIIKFQITSYQARCQEVKSLPLNVGTETRGVSY